MDRPNERGQGGWKAARNHKAARHLEQRLERQRRDEAQELLRRYEDERVDDAEPVPRID